jgi:hypothetical protein
MSEAVQKDKKFKRIRGLLSGESRQKRRERRDKEKAAKSGSSGETDDASTVYGVAVDDRSTATPKVSEDIPELKKKEYMLKVVLLLMDPKTRRFELLQLEFDSNKALVSDVLGQISVSVTEESLRVQDYEGITGKDGKLMESGKLLKEFTAGNEVLVAIPKGMAAKEGARLARPILGDDKVVSMVRFSLFSSNRLCLSSNRSPLSQYTASLKWNRRQGLEREEKEEGD